MSNIYWQPIATAPKKYGQDVLLSDGTSIEIGHRMSDGDSWGNLDFYFRWKPTHWMPLPSLPEIS